MNVSETLFDIRLELSRIEGCADGMDQEFRRAGIMEAIGKAREKIAALEAVAALERNRETV